MLASGSKTEGIRIISVVYIHRSLLLYTYSPAGDNRQQGQDAQRVSSVCPI